MVCTDLYNVYQTATQLLNNGLQGLSHNSVQVLIAHDLTFNWITKGHSQKLCVIHYCVLILVCKIAML